MRLIIYFVIILIITGVGLYFSENYERKVQNEEAIIKAERLQKAKKKKALLEYYKMNFNVDSVDLSNLDLKYFPSFLILMDNLKYLNLANNQITEFDNDILDLENLEYLNLSNNQLTHIYNPNRKSNLKHLILSHNQLDNSLISGFDSLRTLDLSFNKMRYKYHISNQEFPKLESVNLSNNRIEKISGLESLLKLKKANFANNELTKIPFFGEYTNLIYLDISANQISNLSYSSLIPTTLQIILLGNNEIEIFDFNPFFQNVEHLDLSNNHISHLGEMYYYDELNYLNLSGNYLNDNIRYSDDIAVIDSVDFSNNDITNFSWNSSILTYLNLENNDLIIENCVLETNQLEYLNISGNQVENPDLFNNTIRSNLPNLKRIDASNTSVCEDKTKSYLNSAIIYCE